MSHKHVKNKYIRAAILAGFRVWPGFGRAFSGDVMSVQPTECRFMALQAVVEDPKNEMIRPPSRASCGLLRLQTGPYL